MAISKLNLKKLFPFELDDFQKQAIAALDRGKSVVVCAPTGSGKTLIGEYAIYRALDQKKRVLYTTPLKALSNQKLRDFQEKFGSPKLVGLITGDEVENPEAPIVVMTTEVFRNMLYETPIGQVGTSLENVVAVVLDECHYISESSRGTVWEESIIYCPPTIQLVALSATIGNPEQLTDWINQVREAGQPQKQGSIKHCELINSDFRPVPLQFHFSNTHGLFPLLDKSQKLNRQLKSKRKGGNQYGRTRREDCPSTAQILNQLTEQEILPAIYLIFSRRGCDQAVEQLDFNLTTSEERERIQVKLLQFFLADNPDLQAKLLTHYQGNRELQGKLLGFLANNPGATEQLWQYLEENGKYRADLWQFLIAHGEGARAGQIEPL
ncbi:MAG: DEAD/DEAH box helicase, partial [Prochloron sp. SP5CPC1]|nr:DEAD/DEAH box helicase [Candidatus Paraprochloron terpiosi SP5CPC1]